MSVLDTTISMWDSQISINRALIEWLHELSFKVDLCMLFIVGLFVWCLVLTYLVYRFRKTK